MAGNGIIGFSIGEVSQSIGLGPQTRRLWEKEGQVHPSRTGRDYRVHTRDRRRVAAKYVTTPPTF